MADAGGHWLNLEEAQKLTQEHLVPGVIDENVRMGGLLSLLPLAQAIGLTIDWNRSSAERVAQNISIGETLTWSDNITYALQSVGLKQIFDQSLLNNFIASVYGTINNYEAQKLLELRGGMVKKTENDIIYGDLTYSTGNKEFDGLHAFAAVQTGTDLDIDEGEGALSLFNLRVMIDAMKAGIDFLLMPKVLARRIDASVQEAGIASFVGMGSVGFTVNEIGKRVTHFDGVPIIRSDYMVAEQANTGVGSDARAKYTSGTKMYSILGVKMGQVMQGEPGITLAFGGTENAPGEIFRLELFDKMETQDAKGQRLVSYLAMLNGASFAQGRIYDITDAKVTS